MPLTGFHNNLSVLLAEYYFERETDVVNYLGLCKIIGAYFDEVVKYETRRKEKGLMTNDATIDAVIKECKIFAEKKEDNFLINVFDSKIEKVDFLDTTQKEHTGMKI